MAYIIAVTNQKGGVGKTTTTAAIAAGLSRFYGKRTLAIDMDPQCNLTFTDGAIAAETSVRDLLFGRSAADCIAKGSFCDIIPSSYALSTADREFVDVGAAFRLREGLEAIRDDYDYIIIDTPPNLGQLQIMSLTAANGIIVPLNSEGYSIQGVAQLFENVSAIQKYANPQLGILGCLLTRFDARRPYTQRENQKVIEKMTEQQGIYLFKRPIRTGKAVNEANDAQCSIFDTPSKPADDYKEFLKELIERIEQ